MRLAHGPGARHARRALSEGPAPQGQAARLGSPKFCPNFLEPEAGLLASLQPPLALCQVPTEALLFLGASASLASTRWGCPLDTLWLKAHTRQVDELQAAGDERVVGLLGRLGSPLRGYRLLRRCLAEVRGIRKALERQAAAMELQGGASGPRESIRAQVFRGYAHLKDPGADDSTVTYVDGQVLAAMLEREDELRALLGRDPTPDEVMAAYEGEVDVREVPRVTP